ncbi:MAG TPA: carbohydrate kinase family protein [Gaiellales bacterium]
MSAVGVVGHEAADVVITPAGTERRPGGTPIYARRSLEALGVTCVVVERGGFGSRLHHHDGILEQRVEAVGAPFAPGDLLAAVAGCRWVILGGQTAGDFPPETIAALAEAGHRVTLDGQGLCRGDVAGPVRLRPFPPEAIRGVSILKLNRAEAEAAAGSLEPEALAALGAPEVAVTLGSDGALGVAAGRGWRSESTGTGEYPDPTGAGDTWTAAYVVRRAAGDPPEEAAHAAALHADHLYL